MILPQVDVVAIAGSLPQGFSVDELQQLIKLIQQQGKKLHLIQVVKHWSLQLNVNHG